MKKERIQKAINRIRVNIKTAFRLLHDDYNYDRFMAVNAFRDAAIELVLTLAEMLEVDYDGLGVEFGVLVDDCIAGGSDEWDDKIENRTAIAQFLNKTFGIDWAKM